MPPSSHDHQPLLSSPHDHSDEPDTRFTIDYDGDEDQDPYRPLPARDEDEDEDEEDPHKYPPLPPSYDEAILHSAPNSSWNSVSSWFTLSRTTREHLQGCLPHLRRSTNHADAATLSERFTKLYRNLLRYLPTSRFAQASVFIFGLWILVILTGPGFYDGSAGNGAGGYSSNYDYASIPDVAPLPLKGDGKVAESASWTWHGCQSSNHLKPGKVVCTSTASFLLDPNKAKDSFQSTDSIFLDVDPIRTNRPEPAGSVAGKVNLIHESKDVVRKEEERGMVKVEITATYDEQSTDLFNKTLVAKTKRSFFDEGVEILTYVKYTQQDSPVRFDVDVLFPYGVNVPTFECETGSAHIEAFLPSAGSKKARGSGTEQPALLLGDRAGLVERDSSGEGEGDSYPSYFGKLHLKTLTGDVSLGSTKALVDINMSTSSGRIHVEGHSRAMRIRTKGSSGQVTLAEGSKLEALIEASLRTQNGDIVIGKGSWIKATRVTTETSNGNLLAGQATLFANNTLTMRTSNGRIEAQVGVTKPDKRLLDGKVGKRTDFVEVEASTSNGAIQLTYSEHEVDVPLKSIASSKLGNVEVNHHVEFQGTFQMLGSTNSRLEGKGSKPGRVTETKADKRTRWLKVDSDSYGWINRQITGRIWWGSEQEDPSEKAGSSQLDSVMGLVVLRFAEVD
ncbi:hypothetical protein IE53DRAFT_390752 [Violaceomyces palustris]|uniref:Uncharacterized protein n=1 Tax=Violaceomyces palustris TaxID=1673888 RepID=A0ACD0NMS4_9BASI|nr:hypothetical protein IE53DRAFT_390752 [Violaceomyces palustris]